MVFGVGYVEVAGGVDGEAAGEGEGCVGGGAVVSAVGCGAGSCDGGDDAGSGVDATDAVVVGVGQVEVAGGVGGEAGG